MPNVFENSATLIEDLHLTKTPPVAGNIYEGSFSAVQDHSARGAPYSLITAAPSGNESTPTEVSRFFRVSDSIAGWSREVIQIGLAPPKVPIERIASYYVGAGGKAQDAALFVMALYPRAAPANTFQLQAMCRDPGGKDAWTAVNFHGTPFDNLLSGSLLQLDALSSFDGNTLLYGISEIEPGNSKVFFINTRKSADMADWTLAESTYNAGTSCRVVQSTSGDGLTFVSCKPDKTLDFTPITIDAQGVVALDTAKQASWSYGALKIAKAVDAEQIIPLPQSAGGSYGFLIQTCDGALYSVTGYAAGSAAVEAEELTSKAASQDPPAVFAPPAKTTRVECGIDIKDRFNILASDENNQLWALVQTPGDSLAFGAWRPLGDAVSLIACPARMVCGAEAFYYDGADASVYYLCQDPATTLWQNYRVAVPQASGEKKHKQSYTLPDNTYAHEILLQEAASGSPIRNAAVTINTDRKSIIEVNGVTYHCGPGKDDAIDALQTDVEGKITVGSRATGLLSPKITITATESKVSQVFSADEDVHQRLAGQDKGFKVNGTTMHQGGVLAKSVKGKDAKKVADKVTSVAQAGLKLKNGNSRFDPPAGAYVTKMAPAGQGLTCDLIPDDEFAAMRAAASSFGGDIGDAIHWFEKAVKKIDQVAIKIEHDIEKSVIKGVQFVIRHGGKLIQFVTTTLEETFDALKSYFAVMAEIIKDVVDFVVDLLKWLRFLFDWKNVLVTKDCFKDVVSGGMPLLAGGIGDAMSLVNQEVTKVEKDIDHVFDELLAKIMPKGRSFGKSVAPVKSPFTGSGTQSPMKAAGYNQTHRKHAMRMNYLRRKAQQNYSSATTPSLYAEAALPGSDPVIEALNDVYKKIESDPGIKQTGQQMLAKLGDIKSLDDFLKVAAYEFFSLFKLATQAACDAVKGVIKAIGSVAESCLKLMLALLEKPIHIPLVSDIYSIISGGAKLRFLDLFALIGAVPATLIYELLFNKAPIKSDEVETISALVTAGRWVPGQKQEASGTVGKASDATLHNLAIVLLLSSGVLTLFDAVNYAIDATEDEEGAEALPAITDLLSGCSIFFFFTSLCLATISYGESLEERGLKHVPISMFGFAVLLAVAVFIAANKENSEDLAEAAPTINGVFGILVLYLSIVDTLQVDGVYADANELQKWSLCLAPLAPMSQFLLNFGVGPVSKIVVLILGEVMIVLGDLISPTLSLFALEKDLKAEGET